MAQENPVTPEKQLLNLIEKPMTKTSINAAAMKYHGKSLFSLGALRGRFAFLRHRVKGEMQSGSFVHLDVRTVNQYLKVCVAVLALYFLINLYASITNLKKDIQVSPKLMKTSEGESLQVSSLLKSASYYLEKARERDIFTMNKKPVSNEAGLPKVSAEKIAEATQNLRLVGISWSDDPDVMIEDTKIQRTFFLKKGQVLEKDIRLKAVFKDKVILSYAGEEIELR
ncbi:MAG TPA: hypothetical protein VMD04_02025 [Candidatus Margulisiibacteriota bacterium]|nr:hypothetical protein [Candidatus Margulisiibacteriota bacterium]